MSIAQLQNRLGSADALFPCLQSISDFGTIPAGLFWSPMRQPPCLVVVLLDRQFKAVQDLAQRRIMARVVVPDLVIPGQEESRTYCEDQGFG